MTSIETQVVHPSAIYFIYLLTWHKHLYSCSICNFKVFCGWSQQFLEWSHLNVTCFCPIDDILISFIISCIMCLHFFWCFSSYKQFHDFLYVYNRPQIRILIHVIFVYYQSATPVISNIYDGTSFYIIISKFVPKFISLKIIILVSFCPSQLGTFYKYGVLWSLGDSKHADTLLVKRPL